MAKDNVLVHIQQITVCRPSLACSLFWYSLQIKNGFYIRKWLIKSKEEYISRHVTVWETQTSVSIIKFYWNAATPICLSLSMASFALQQQS